MIVWDDEAERLSPEERAARDAFLEGAKEMTELVSVRVGDMLYLTSTADRSVGRGLFIRGNRAEMRLLRKALGTLERRGAPVADGSVFVDVGANIGTTTFSALTQNGFRSAVAIEPEPFNASLLRATAALNGLTGRLTVVEAAASRTPGRASLQRSAKSGSHKLVAREAGQRDYIDVDVVSLDQLAQRGLIDPARVGLVWMDAQYQEPEVLAGATAFTSAGVPVVLEYVAAKTNSELLWEIAREAYTHAVMCRSGETADLADSGAIARLFGDEPGEKGNSFDVLLARLPANG